VGSYGGIGQFGPCPRSCTAFVWTGELGFLSLQQHLLDLGLDLTGWALTEATGISGATAGGHTIIGNGINPDGQQEAWIATIPSISCALADLNCDGSVDVFDLLILLGAWGPCPPAEPGADGSCGECAADLNGDCAVDVFDLLILLSNWS
jgi:hypothetical protein